MVMSVTGLALLLTYAVVAWGVDCGDGGGAGGAHA